MELRPGWRISGFHQFCRPVNFAFTACFAVWTIFSIIGVQIKQDLGLSEAQFGLLAGTPILTGSLVRVLLGVWTDQYGGRLVNLMVMLSAALATCLIVFGAVCIWELLKQVK